MPFMASRAYQFETLLFDSITQGKELVFVSIFNNKLQSVDFMTIYAVLQYSLIAEA